MEHINAIPSSPAINYQQMNPNQTMHTYQTHVYHNEPNSQAQNASNMQSNSQGNDLDQNDLGQILKIFQKYNLKESEEIFRRELNRKNGIEVSLDPTQKEREFYYDIYESLTRFVESTKENKYELSQVLYPIFIHLYMDMINKDYLKMSQEFFSKYSIVQTPNHALDIKKLKSITNKEQLNRSEFRETYGTTKYNVKLSDESYRLLKDFVKVKNSKPLVDLIKENMMLEIYNGPLRDHRQQSQNAGGLLGESNSNNNTERIFYGLLKEPEQTEEAEDLAGEGGEETEKPKKRKNKREALMNKKNRQDPNAPQFNRIPLPEIRSIDRMNRKQAAKDYLKRARLGPESLPSICFYTILNSFNLVNCIDLSDDSCWLALGLSDSTVKICTLNEKLKLRTLRALHELESLDKESDDIFNLMFDEHSGVDHKTLAGHSGPVYGVCFSPDKYFVVSGSEDGTVRLWCLLTFSCLVSYRGHNGPVWDVKFGPYGHYFASCGMDKTARIWATDQQQSLRLYTDHLADVECLCFHPNSNYLATGSSDRTIRIYDLGSIKETHQVRQYTGHKDVVNVIKFSACGRYLGTGGNDGTVLVWDISKSVIVANLNSHKQAIYSLDFSRDNTVFATGGLDNTVKVWNMAKLCKEVEQSEDFSKFVTRNETHLEIGSWQTKLTPILHLHFTRRNLLVGIGPFSDKK